MDFKNAELKSLRPYSHFEYNPEPQDWSVLDYVDWNKPIIIEVGCGKGEWISEEAQRHPQKTYIGIERTQNKSQDFLSIAARLNLPNLIAVRADAIALIHQKVPAESVEALYFYYPNPMPKRSQANQRFFVGSSFEVFDRCLKDEGQVYLCSNIADYVKEARVFLKQFWNYKIEKHGLVKKDLEPRTGFERKYLNKGEDLFELKAQKMVSLI